MIVGSGQDPAPAPADFLNWDNFIRFIRENNNVTWRNFDVVPASPSVDDPTVPKGFQALPFLVVGAPDIARPMWLEVSGKLPAGSRVFLEVPLALLDLLRQRGGRHIIDKKRERALIAVPTRGRHVVGVAGLPARARYAARLLVQLGDTVPGCSYDVAVRQLWEKTEVGRLTWRLVAERERGEGAVKRPVRRVAKTAARPKKAGIRR